MSTPMLSAGSTFDSTSMKDVLTERARWNQHTQNIKEAANELSGEEALAAETRERMGFRSEMHNDIKMAIRDESGVSRAISKTHSDVYRRALKDAEDAICALRDQETKGRMIESCIVDNERYFKSINLTLRMKTGSVTEEHRVGNVDTSTLRPLVCSEQMVFFEKVKELGVIINKAICERSNSFIAEPKNICEGLGNLFSRHLLKRFPAYAPIIHLTLTHDTVADYTEVERTSVDHITAGAFVDLSFSMNSSRRCAFADCVIEYKLENPPCTISFFEWLACQNQIDEQEVFRLATHYTMYYNFGNFVLNNTTLVDNIFLDRGVSGGENHNMKRAWFQIFRDAYFHKYGGDQGDAFAVRLGKLDSCASILPDLAPYYIFSPRVAMFHLKRGQNIRKYWFCVDMEWPLEMRQLQSFVIEVLGRFKHKTVNVVVSVPSLPAFLTLDMVEKQLNLFDVEVYTKPVKNGECVTKIFLDAKKPTKMIVC